MTKERIVFYASKTDKELLERISKQTGAPASELLRRALKAMLKEQKMNDLEKSSCTTPHLPTALELSSAAGPKRQKE